MTAYLHNDRGYPIITSRDDIVPALREPYTRAVVLRDPASPFDATEVRAANVPESVVASYWKDETHRRGRVAAGENSYLEPLTTSHIILESLQGGISLSDRAIVQMTERCNQYRDLFDEVFQKYTGLRVPHRGYLLFTPEGGMGRSPELHVDNTVLTLHWSTALAKFSLYKGEPSERLWAALDRVRQDQLTPEERAENFRYLVSVASDPNQTRDNDIGDVMLTKGQRGVNVSDPAVRQGLCAHASSQTIIQNGQAAYLMTPQMPKI